MTLLFSDPLYLQHDTGSRHPERPQRLYAIVSRLEQAGLTAQCRPGVIAPLTPADLLSTHTSGQVEAVRLLSEQGGGYLDGDTPVSKPSYSVALAAAGACVAAVDGVLDGTDRNALCLVRPPGHHATPTRSMGFCLFNNIALAARRAIQRGLSRVLIVDWDVHHGNGTQDVFYADPQVTFFSIHRYGWGFYPGTGDEEDTGTGAGLGYTLNAPIEYETPVAEYHAVFRAKLAQAVEKCKPELVLISAGFDADLRDPIGGLGLSTEDFALLSREVLDAAKVHARGRVVTCLEGGYNLDALAEGVEVHLRHLLTDSGS